MSSRVARPAKCCLAGLAAVSAVLPSGPAHAVGVPGVIATAAFRFVPPDTFIGVGGSLTLANADRDPHDVTSSDFGPDNRPLFRSETIGIGVAPVVGVESLPSGLYPFYCTVHGEMQGLLTISNPPPTATG